MTEWALAGTLGLIGLQTALMSVDEMYFHRRRGLERLEAWGHAFDTALFLAAISVPDAARCPETVTDPVQVPVLRGS